MMMKTVSELNRTISV